jgi:hypothetical protein
MKKSSNNLKTGHMEFSTMTTSKICALLSPRKMAPNEKCFALSAREEYLQSNYLHKKIKPQLARLLDPQFGFSTQKNKNGDPSAGTQ